MIQILPARSRWLLVGVSYGTVFVLFSSILAEPEDQPIVKRLFFIEIVSFDWNRPKYITPRFTEAKLELATALLQHRIAESEAKLKGSNSNLS